MEPADAGICAFGILWAGATIGFGIAAVAALRNWTAWQRILIAVTLFSWVLTTLDWTVAYADIVVNVVILAALILLPPL